MDDYKSAIAGAGALGFGINIFLILSIVGIYVALCVYFGIYAFANPNNACFYGKSEAGVEFISGV